MKNKIKLYILVSWIVLALVFGCSDMMSVYLGTDTTDAAQAADALTEDDFTFTGSDSRTSITTGFTVPVTGEVEGTTISWESDNTSIISIESDGTVTIVTRPAVNTSVTLTATITDAAGNTVTKEFTVTVLPFTVSTIAGTGTAGSADGNGTAASFDNPLGMDSDGTNLYVVDKNNDVIRKIVISTGEVTTFATFSNETQQDVVIAGADLYTVGTNSVWKVALATGGAATRIAGNPASGNTDATGLSARFSNPTGITTDGTNLYVVDSGNHIIRQIVIDTVVVTTLAGSTIGFADGTGVAAQFDWPNGITTDGTNLYVTDTGNAVIRKIVISSGVVTTFAGTQGSTGSADGTGTAASFTGLSGIDTDGTRLYVADTFNELIREVIMATAEVATVAGIAGTQGSADGTKATATFYRPAGIVKDDTGLYIADTLNHLIRKIR